MHVSGKRLHARSESPSVFWRGEIQSTAALPLLCFCSIYSLFCFLFCVFFGSPDRNSVMRNTNPQQTIIILGRKHTSVEVRNFFFPSGQIDNRWIINPVWEWALTSHSGYRCWTKFFFPFIFSIPSFRLVAFPVQIRPSLIVPRGLLCSYNSGNVINSDLWQLWKHVHACPTEHETHAPSLDSSVSSAFVCFLQNSCTSGLKGTEIPVKMSGLFYFACLTHRE